MKRIYEDPKMQVLNFAIVGDILTTSEEDSFWGDLEEDDGDSKL